MQISAKTRLICLIVAAVFLFGLLVGTSTYLIINHLNNSKALLNNSARVYLGNLFDGADALNSTTYNNLITELGAYDTNTIKQQSDINEGVPIVFQMGTAPNGNPIEWQVVYQYGDIITVWMTDIYTCAEFGPSGPANTYYSDASVRDVLQDIYELIESQNSSMQNIVVSTNDSKIPEEYKEQQATEKSSGYPNAGPPSYDINDIANVNDKFWLVSMYELTVIWELGTDDLSYGDGGTNVSCIDGTVADADNEVYTDRCFTRTGNKSIYNWLSIISPSGAFSYNGWGKSGIRPACHISLSALKDLVRTMPDLDAVTIGELYDENGVSATNIQNLLNCLSNDTNGDLYKIFEYLDIHEIMTAEDIRAFNTDKNAGESIIVTFGGFEWIVSCVSSVNEEIIVTLWLAGDNIFDSSTYAYCEQGAYGADSDTGVPSNMYGTSYIRAKLNNDGYYAVYDNNINNPTSLTGQYAPIDNYKFQSFLKGGVLNEFLVTPSQIIWQEREQSENYKIYNNDNWSDDENSSYAGQYYSAPDNNQYGNGTWKDDYLWLPSVTEMSIWKLSVEERMGNSFNPYWFRSAWNNATQATLSKSGGIFVGHSTVNNAFDIKPAIHLNLSKLASSSSIKNIYLDGELPNGVYILVNGELLKDKVYINVDTVEDLKKVKFKILYDTVQMSSFYKFVGFDAKTNYDDEFCSYTVPLNEFLEFDLFMMDFTDFTSFTSIWFRFIFDEIQGVFDTVSVGVELQDAQSNNSAVGEARITGYSGENFDYIHVSAIAYKGYRFVGWKIDGEFIYSGVDFMSTNIPLSEIEYSYTKKIIAVFEPITDTSTNTDTDNDQNHEFG